MNGFRLLVLLVLAGQVGLSGPTGSMVARAQEVPGLGAPPLGLNGPGAGGLTTPPAQQDYGWQVYLDANQQPRLEYIVQIAPGKVKLMEERNQEFESLIPPAVAARVSRIVVTIGTEPIISTPINEVMRIEPVTRDVLANNVQDEVGRGRYADLESTRAADVQNVSGGAPPPSLPTGGLQSRLGDAATSLSDKIAQATNDPTSLLAQSGMGSSFLQDARGTGAAPTSKFPNGAPAFPNAAAGGLSPAALPNNNAAANHMPTSTAPPASPVGTTGATPNFPSATFPTPGYAGAGNTGGASTPTGYNPGVNAPYPGNTTAGNLGAGTNYTNTPNYSNTPNYTNTPNITAPQNSPGNFGAAPRGVGQQPLPGYTNPNAPYGQYGAAGTNGGFVGTNYNNTTGSPYIAPTDPPSMRVADQRGLPSTTSSQGATSSFDSPRSTQRDDWARSGTGVGTGQGVGQAAGTGVGNGSNNFGADANRSGIENIMPIMFVLSLLVNFYLGMLMRKLLGRYKTLLSSVRSQAV